MTGSLVSPATRQRVRDLATPIATALGRLGLTPNALTFIGFLGACVAAVTAANELWVVAGLLVIGFGAFDLLDGALARATGGDSRLGAFFDSTFDRAGEGIVYLGILAGLQSSGYINGPLFAAAAGLAAFMVSYTRAKSESLGFAENTGMAAIGVMPREVRIPLLALGLILGGLMGTTIDSSSCPTCAGGGAFPTGMLVIHATLVIIALGATITTVQRVLHVRAQSREG